MGNRTQGVAGVKFDKPGIKRRVHIAALLVHLAVSGLRASSPTQDR